MFQSIITFFFFFCKSAYCSDCDNASDSGISESWRSSYISEDSTENSPLLVSTVGSSYRLYTEEKIQYYGDSRKQENEVLTARGIFECCGSTHFLFLQMGEADHNQVTDVRGTVTITGKGSCEV